MNDEVLLTLHCPQCKKITDVVTENNNLVCLDCGYKFDESVAAKFLSGGSQEPPVKADAKR
jgi:hypothetical protein